ncbi:hypothetical protein LQZ19_15890 [Treponema primitia]|uniref:hypothetical protein n=1 Tax=Treponema primitia TaxID=88058 RepID=UPI0039819436
MLNKDINEDTGSLMNHDEDELSEENVVEWMKKHSRKIGKFTIKPMPMGHGKPSAFLETISNWWWNLSNVFWFGLKIGLSGIKIHFWVLDMGFTFEFNLPCFRIHLPLGSKLDWHAFAHLKKDKGIEIQTWGNDNLTAGFDIRINMHTDHFGLFGNLDLLFLHMEFSRYDGRHWNDGKHRPDEWRGDEIGCEIYRNS